MVYETGTFSAADNPMTVPGLGGTNAARDTQAAAAAGAVATSLPLLAVVFALAAGSVLGGRRTSAAEALETGVSWPRVLDAGAMAKALAVGIVIVTLVVPTVSMILSLKRPFDLPRMYATFQPQLLGSLSVSAVTGVIAVVLALWASVRRERVLLVLALGGFLVGGQLLAIAQIRLYNRPWLSWIYNAPPIIVMAYLARFGWVALAAGRTTWSSHAWRQLRDMAAVDGATVGQTARYVVWPLAWPVAAAAGVLVMILSLTEVPATVLLAPQQPPLLVPLLMTWVHMLRYDDMLEGTLLLMAAVFVLTAVVMGLAALAVRVNGKWKMENGKWGSRTALFLMMLGLLVGGCFDGAKPEAVWGETGIGPAQVVYPRGISYSKQSDTFFVVDRMARIQQLDQKGECLSEWRMPQWQTGKPVGLTAGPDGLVYVADTHYHRVMVYQPDGAFVREWGTYGTGPGQFILPTDVAFDDKGNVFVAEYGDNDRIQVFDRDGTFLYEFGRFGQGDGELSRPQSIVIDARRIYVADACNHRVAVFTTDGTFLRNMGSVGGEPGQFRFPYGIDIDSRGRLVVCEFGNNRIQLVDKETGKGLETWGTGGRELGQLTYPWAVAVDKNDRVVAVDSGNNRLQVFEF